MRRRRGYLARVSEAVWILVGGVLGAAATAFGMLATVRRVVRRQVRAERRARDAARLAEIGSMTKGLAHEIKNPLSTIGLNAQLLGEALEELEIDAGERDRLVRRAGALTREVERLREILEDFLRYAGEFRLAPGVIDLGAAAREFGDFFEPQAAREGVRLEVRVEGEVRAWADTDAVKQALLNLALNATQAMGSTNGEGGGAVVIGASLGEDEEVGACALLWVSDEGPGGAGGEAGGDLSAVLHEPAERGGAGARDHAADRGGIGRAGVGGGERAAGGAVCCGAASGQAGGGGVGV